MAAATAPRARASLSRSVEVERILVVSLVILVGMRIDFRYGLQVGPLLGIVLMPVWIRDIARIRWFPTLALLLAVAAVSGVLLSLINADHGISRLLIVERTSSLVTLGGGLGVLLWARLHVSAAAMAVAFGVGMLAGIPLNMSENPNQWRFTYSIPVIIFALAAVSRYKGPARVPLQVITALGLAGVGLVNDSRSNSAMLVLAALAAAWHAVDHVVRRGRGGVYLLGVWAVCCFFLVQGAVLSGTFGDAIQSRTQAQIEQSGGNVLLGGRPEIAASVELISHDPWGLGSGTLATYDSVSRAKTAMASIGYDPNNGYVERFMFGNGIEVHSGFGDYWIWFGIPGVLLVLLIVVVTFNGIRREYDRAALTVLSAYLATRVAWDLAFSPAPSSVGLLSLALALFLTTPALVGQTQANR